MTDIQIDYMTTELLEQEAKERHERICARQKAVELSFIDQGGDLYEMFRRNEFEVLGYASFDAYVANPEVNVGVRMAYMMKGCYETFCKNLEVDHDRLARIGISKLDMIRPIVSGYNSDEWLNNAETLSRSDLRILIDQHLGRMDQDDYGDELDDDESGESAAAENETEVLRSALTNLLNEFLKVRPDYRNSPVVRAAIKALKGFSIID